MKAVTFDCWGTLINDQEFGASYELRAQALREIAPGQLDEQATRDLLNRAWRLHHTAWLRGEQYGAPGAAAYCLTELELHSDERHSSLSAAFEDAGLSGRVEALPGALATLERLRAAGIRTALVCDAGYTPGRNVRKLLDGVGLLDLLEATIFSDEVGVPKPDPRMFHHALQAIGTEPSEAVHVGDLLRTDVLGARQVGMRTVRITEVTDDREVGFSWDPNSSPGGDRGKGKPASGELPEHLADADEVVASHHELPDALRRLGVPLD